MEPGRPRAFGAACWLAQGVPCPVPGSVWCLGACRFLGEPLSPQLCEGLWEDTLVPFRAVPHPSPGAGMHRRVRHQGHGSPWEGELETSRSVGSEHHGVLKGPLHLSWSLELEGDTVPPTGSSAQGCCRQQISLLDLFDAQYHKVVVVTKPPPGPPQFGTLWSLWSVVPPQSQDPLGGATTPLAPGTSFSGWLFQSCLQQVFPVALVWPCHTLLLWSVCSRSGNCCECTRTLQHVTLPGDTVENPSSKRLVVCWRLRQRRSISSCWHSPAFVHHIWPRWKLS